MIERNDLVHPVIKGGRSFEALRVFKEGIQGGTSQGLHCRLDVSAGPGDSKTTARTRTSRGLVLLGPEWGLARRSGGDQGRAPRSTTCRITSRTMYGCQGPPPGPRPMSARRRALPDGPFIMAMSHMPIVARRARPRLQHSHQNRADTKSWVMLRR